MQAASLIREIQGINKQLTNLAEIDRNNRATELRQAAIANKALDAYGR